MAPRTPTRTPPSHIAATWPRPRSAVEERLCEVQARMDRLEAQVRQAQQLSTLGSTAAVFAHEINNLLTPIVGYAGAALQANDVELHKKALTVCVKNARILVAMSARVLELGAAREPKREAVALAGVVEDAAASLCRDLAKDAIRFKVRIDEPLTLWADRLQVHQVLFNLFLNAREALVGQGGGTLSVEARRHEQSAVVEIRNTGEVIPPDLLAQIFEPFRTSKTVQPEDRPRCSGLGLALCRDLVNENGGTIEVASHMETGTTFTIVLPLACPTQP